MNQREGMFQHTKGPWLMQEKDLVRWITPPEGEPVAILPKFGSVTTQYRSANETEANARLLAAAPDLLEACKEARDKLPGCMLWSQLNAAIDKATGEN